jgi:hypothetical protein
MTTLEKRRRLIRRRIRITGWSALTSLLVTVIGFLTYFHIVFMADRDATLEVFRDDRVTLEVISGSLVLSPTGEATTAGVLYVPGARVDPYSYLHPLVDVAASGVTVVIMDPLFNMALLDQRNLDELVAAAPSIETWTLAGHSLGGVRACMLADDPRVTGLVLFASYCANDISHLGIPVLQVLASDDGLIDISAVNEARGLLPASATATTIEGANHASFGTYGDQPGDGLATLSRQQVRESVTELMMPLAVSD